MTAPPTALPPVPPLQPVPPVVLADLPGRPCPIAASLELVGERWSLLVCRELWMGNHRFTDIVRGTGAPRDRVAARLRTLEAVGVVERRPSSPTSTRHDYHLTDSGRDLVPVLRALLAWGRAHAVDPGDPDLARSERRTRSRDPHPSPIDHSPTDPSPTDQEHA